MIEMPPPLPPPSGDATSGNGPRRDAWWTGVVAIAVIGLSVAVAMAGVVREKSVMAAEPDHSARMAQVEGEMTARYLVGMNALLGSSLDGVGQSKSVWLDPIEKAAETPRQRLEYEIVRRELLGKNAAPVTVAVPAGASEDERKDWETWARIRAENDSADGSPTAAEVARLKERLGWVGQLAASQAAPGDEAERRVLLGQALRTFVGTAVLTMGGVMVMLIGCGLAMWAVGVFASGRGRWRFPEGGLPVVVESGGTVWLETFAVYLGVMVLGSAVMEFLPGSQTLWPQAVVFVAAAVMGLWWPRFRGLSREACRAGFGWTTGRGIWREVAAGLAGYCAGLPIVAVGVAVTLVLTMKTKSDASHPLNHLTGVSPPALVLLGLLAAVWAPVVEELFFRGAFYAAWRRRVGRWLSAAGTGVIFAAIHPQGWTAIPALGAIGFVFALLREWRGSIIAPMAAHALNNGTLFVMMVVMLR